MKVDIHNTYTQSEGAYGERETRSTKLKKHRILANCLEWGNNNFEGGGCHGNMNLKSMNS